MSDGRVKGFCPMGCGETLFLGHGGYVTCHWTRCPNPSAASDVLEDRETEHIVVIEAERFNVQHPLRERLNGDMFECGLHKWLSSLDGPPRKPGRYRVRQQPPIPTREHAIWTFEELPR